MSETETKIIDIAFELVACVKTHEYPTARSKEFIEITELFDRLETLTIRYKKEQIYG